MPKKSAIKDNAQLIQDLRNINEDDPSYDILRILTDIAEGVARLLEAQNKPVTVKHRDWPAGPGA